MACVRCGVSSSKASVEIFWVVAIEFMDMILSSCQIYGYGPFLNDKCRILKHHNINLR